MRAGHLVLGAGTLLCPLVALVGVAGGWAAHVVTILTARGW